MSMLSKSKSSVKRWLPVIAVTRKIHDVATKNGCRTH